MKVPYYQCKFAAMPLKEILIYTTNNSWWYRNDQPHSIREKAVP